MELRSEHSHTLILADATLDFQVEHFSAEYWRDKRAIIAEKRGRAAVYFVKSQAGTAVLRHYWRGGLIGKLLKDQYLYFGLKHTRVYREFALLCQLHQLGLAVPKPLAARVSHHGCYYRGDILTAAIAGAHSLNERLQARSLMLPELKAVAATLAQFHRAGVYHADLNINNILFSSDNRVYVIDFDRGELRQPDTRWQQQNMARLARSFNKEAGRQEVLHWSEDNWQQLQKYYQRALTA
ncbi:3-deoxy-D-manno-octulosonic acid kinase [Pseudoalteromonas fenneropenaei]|uniref:3-deoxy-D-manno-octulosonic acid kinase n=1 Tax=Pseudoalteromonas fenneropenaei TaxID=1737459 RepID=A0ABV7CNI8_9GAMM